MAQYESVEHQKIAATVNSGVVPATFEGGIQQLYVCCDGDVFLALDEPAVASQIGLLIKANLAPTRLSFGGGNVQKVYAVTASSTANVYLMGVRGRG